MPYFTSLHFTSLHFTSLHGGECFYLGGGSANHSVCFVFFIYGPTNTLYFAEYNTGAGAERSGTIYKEKVVPWVYQLPARDKTSLRHVLSSIVLGRLNPRYGRFEGEHLYPGHWYEHCFGVVNKVPAGSELEVAAQIAATPLQRQDGCTVRSLVAALRFAWALGLRPSRASEGAAEGAVCASAGRKPHPPHERPWRSTRLLNKPGAVTRPRAGYPQRYG
ncbi:MAG: hypothetical protein AAF355_09615 [Myxococcota bacterium]